MIEETRSRLAALAQEFKQAKGKAADLKSSAVAVQKEYDKIMSWAPRRRSFSNCRLFRSKARSRYIVC